MDLSFAEKLLLVWYLAHAHSYDTRNNQQKTRILFPVRQTLAKNDKGGNRFQNSRHSIPDSIDKQDIGTLETFNGEIDDPEISEDTAAKICELVAACKELQMKVTEYFGQTQEYHVNP
jgi:hypothetical protein